MKKILILILILINSFMSGCALVSPWSAPSSCEASAENGAPCASMEENLQYSIKKDNKEEVRNLSYNEDVVNSDELSRVLTELALDSSSKKPTFIPAKTYRILVYPYSAGTKFYSARFIYITAGKPQWLTANYVVSNNDMVKVSVPEVKQAPKKEKLTEINVPTTLELKPDVVLKNANQKKIYKVEPASLNCRAVPDVNGEILTVLEENQTVAILDNSYLWWLVRGENGTECYVNSKYLYSE